MKCPTCGHEDTQIVYTRHTEHGVRRRRGCPNCAYRWFTLETTETIYQKAADIVEAYRAMGRVVGEE